MGGGPNTNTLSRAASLATLNQEHDMSIGSIGSTSAYSSAYTSSSRKSSDSKELQEKLFKSIDTDGDGSITSSELTNALDSNSDRKSTRLNSSH